VSAREAWLAVLEDEDGNEETELVTVSGVTVTEGATIETTSGERLTFTERAAELEPAA
jgi:hypothetical protein